MQATLIYDFTFDQFSKVKHPIQAYLSQALSVASSVVTQRTRSTDVRPIEGLIASK